MKKFISFVMAGAMVASLVPATAFAKGDVTATAKVVDAEDLTKDEAKVPFTKENAPEVQLKVTSVDYKKTDSGNYKDYKKEFEVTLDNAEFTSKPSMGIRLDEAAGYVVTTDADGTTWVKKAANSGATTDKAAAVTAASNALVAWIGGTSYVEADLKSASKFDESTAAGGTAKLLADAKTALQTAKNAAATSEAAAVVTAKNKVTDEKNKILLAEAAVTKAEKDLATAKDELAEGTGTVDAVNAAQLTLDTAKTNFDEVKAAVAAALPALEAAVTAAEAAFEVAVEKDTDVIAKKALLATAETNNSAAKATYVSAYDAYKAADGDVVGGEVVLEIKVTDWDSSDPETAEFTVYGQLHKDDVLFVDLAAKLTKTSEGTKATVSVDSDAVTADDLVFASVLGKGLKASVKKTVDVATEEKVTLHSNGLKIEAAVGYLPSEITLKISNGFEFVKNATYTGATVTRTDEKELKITGIPANTDEITIKGIEIEAASAKTGAVATITVKASNNDSASVEVAKVVDYKVSFTVDADEDLPVIYSGVDAENTGITNDSDHFSLEVTAKETFPGAWSMRQGFNFNLPDGVYVTDVDVVSTENFRKDNAGNEVKVADWERAFFDAYQKGDHKNFEFEKRVFNDVDTQLEKDPAEVVFKLQLVADPTFEGDVKLAFEGSLVDKQEVTIAKFVKPYTVKAEQNDVIIDYRNTEVKTPIVITEAEEGLWKKDAAKFTFNIETGNIKFEDDVTFTVDADSDLELKSKDTKDGEVTFTVKSESDKAASVTISDMKLFMERNIPAGGYDLEIKTSLNDAYKKQVIFAPDAISDYIADETAREKAIEKIADAWTGDKRPSESDAKKDSYVDDPADFSKVVKEAFINVVTSGRDNDNLFTTKVVVPVGEAYIVAGENQVALDVPAYISAAGYTMLPIRAVSKALGVDTNNVLWSAETRTITIMYAQRIITMTVGQKTVYVNGSAIPASAAPEIKDGRAFLPLRDLGTALGVTNVTWDAATKTATLN